MRFLILAVLLLSSAVPGLTTPSPVAAAQCDFVLGFKSLHDQIPIIVGECTENERHDPVTGDGFQRTAGGLLFWRKADSHTAFTDGFRTWVAGPFGAEQRLNTERFQWEAVQELREAEYRLPVNDNETPIRLTNGEYALNAPPVRVRAGLISDQVAAGDLDGDAVADVVAPFFLNTGGSGTFIFLIAMVDRDGVLTQAGWALLGDRIKLNSITVFGDGMITVDMITQGPGEPFCCPTLQVTRTFRLEGGELKQEELQR
ncbi:MAG: hypothetical protein Q8O86_07435 [Dehalococcoidia bacterium]|nr:hypothetical protein [Dehalococcoidia bacterium]